MRDTGAPCAHGACAEDDGQQPADALRGSEEGTALSGPLSTPQHCPTPVARASWGVRRQGSQVKGLNLHPEALSPLPPAYLQTLMSTCLGLMTPVNFHSRN